MGLLGARAPAARAEGEGPSRRDRLASLLEPRLAADFHFCEHMGWSFVDDPNVKEVTVHTGRPCTRRSLRDARAKGDLLVRIPKNASDALLLEFAEKLPLLADSVGTRCAYQLRLAEAQSRAMNKLVKAIDDETWTFPQLLVIDSPFWRLRPPETEWVPVEKAWRPRRSCRAAIEACFTQETVTECYAGQLLALFATQYELYGPARFDWAFALDDIWLGRPPLVETVPFGWNCTTTGYHNRRALFVEGEAQNEDPALTLAALGPMAFVGMAGIVKDQAERMHCNENFVIVRISDRAMRDLVKGGGFVAIKKETEKALVLHREAENLFATSETILRNRAAIERILDQPIFTQFDVFIHPYGVVPLRKIAAKKLTDMNSGISFELYCCGREHAFFQRYRGTYHKLWYAQQGLKMPAPAAPRPAPETPTPESPCPPTEPQATPLMRTGYP